MHKFLVCACKSQDFAQSQKFFARSHNRTTARFRNSEGKKGEKNQSSRKKKKDTETSVPKAPTNKIGKQKTQNKIKNAIKR